MTRHAIVWVLVLVSTGCTDKSSSDSLTDTSDSGSALPTDTADAYALGMVTGRVMEDYPWDDLDAEPEPGARIFARTSASDSTIETIADSEGNFSFPLPAGTWKLVASSSDLHCISTTETVISLGADEEKEVSLTIDTCTRDGDTG